MPVRIHRASSSRVHRPLFDGADTRAQVGATPTGLSLCNSLGNFPLPVPGEPVQQLSGPASSAVWLPWCMAVNNREALSRELYSFSSGPAGDCFKAVPALATHPLKSY